MKPKSVHSIWGLAWGAGLGVAVAGAALPRGASIQQLMVNHVDPAADALWGAVGIEETRSGTVQRAPQTDAAWAKAERDAEQLIAGAHALQQPHLAVGGKTHGLLADANTPGIRSAEQIRADIDRDPAKFAAAAARLERAGDQARVAIAARDPARFTAAGAAMDAACEACHAAYWYPRQRLILPSAAEFDRKADRP